MRFFLQFPAIYPKEAGCIRSEPTYELTADYNG